MAGAQYCEGGYTRAPTCYVSRIRTPLCRVTSYQFLGDLTFPVPGTPGDRCGIARVLREGDTPNPPISRLPSAGSELRNAAKKTYQFIDISEQPRTEF